MKPQPRNRPPSIHPLNHWEFLTFQVEVEGPQTWPEKGQMIHGNVKHLPYQWAKFGSTCWTFFKFEMGFCLFVCLFVWQVFLFVLLRYSRIVGGFESSHIFGSRKAIKELKGDFETSQKAQENFWKFLTRSILKVWSTILSIEEKVASIHFFHQLWLMAQVPKMLFCCISRLPSQGKIPRPSLLSSKQPEIS